jgi:PleD family two-component response regulator
LLREIRAILKRRGRKSDASERRSARILLGENDASFADEICAALRCAGHTARVAPDGFKVVEWARAMAPDVILAKEALPGPSKETLFLLMEAMPSTRSIPMVIYDDNGPVGRFGHINALASGPRSEGCSRAGKVVAAVQQALAS